MESIVTFACDHAHSAHWIFFLLLMLAGLNFPISEDIILLTGGALASTCLPDGFLHLFAWIYAGCWLSAWEAYWLGRRFGPQLYVSPRFQKIISPARINKLHAYYEKFGVFTFIVGRFIPGGVRNALFMSSGLGKMPFWKFILRDGFACLISASTIFYIGFRVGENYQVITHYFETYNHLVIAAIIILMLIAAGISFWRKKQSKTPI
jgi:membrane-associated protein